MKTKLTTEGREAITKAVAARWAKIKDEKKTKEPEPTADPVAGAV